MWKRISVIRESWEVFSTSAVRNHVSGMIVEEDWLRLAMNSLKKIRIVTYDWEICRIWERLSLRWKWIKGEIYDLASTVELDVERIDQNVVNERNFRYWNSHRRFLWEVGAAIKDVCSQLSRWPVACMHLSRITIHHCPFTSPSISLVSVPAVSLLSTSQDNNFTCPVSVGNLVSQGEKAPYVAFLVDNDGSTMQSGFPRWGLVVCVSLLPVLYWSNACSTLWSPKGAGQSIGNFVSSYHVGTRNLTLGK